MDTQTARTCTKCKHEKSIDNFSRRSDAPHRWVSWCHECLAAKGMSYRRERKDKMLLNHARWRAKSNGVEFSITIDDVIIPEYCPILGMQLKLDNGMCCPDSPSLDRIVNSLGYIPGNVQVISRKANAMKQDATWEELKTFADWVYKEVVTNVQI